MSSTTLKKIAEELNISPSTVSRALRDSHEISQDTKDKILALVTKLDFQPNPHASSLRKNKSKTIAVVIPEIQNNFFAQVLNGVEEIARAKGYHVLIYLTHEDFKRETGILQTLRGGRVDGIMISVSNSTVTFEHLATYEKVGVPLVFFDRVCEEMTVPCVITDDAHAAFQATEHLITSGCKRILFLSLAPGLSISNGRRSGYLKALDQYGLINEQLIFECGLDDDENRRLLCELLRSDDKIDGIFTAIEKFAITTYEALKEANLKIPQQIKVISFSNMVAAALFDPPLSTIVQPAYEMGKESADILFKIIEKKKLLPTQQRVMIPSRLVIRESSMSEQLEPVLQEYQV